MSSVSAMRTMDMDIHATTVNSSSSSSAIIPTTTSSTSKGSKRFSLFSLSAKEKNQNQNRPDKMKKSSSSVTGRFPYPRRRTKSQETATSSISPSHSHSHSNLESSNVMQWLQSTCPGDVLPKILAFAGPQKTAAISKVNRHWRAVMKEEATWRVLCEDLYKWKAGQEEPESWAEYYRLNPCVPTDWPSIHKALELSRGDKIGRKHRRQNKKRQVRSLRILLRPGSFYMNEAIRVQSLHSITLETMHLPENCFQPPRHRQTTLQNTNGSHKELPEAPAQTRSARSLRDLLLCRTNSSVEVAAQHHQQEQLEPTDFSDYDNAWETDSLADYHYRTPCTRATLVLRSRKANEPAFYVRQGTLCIKDINIHHHSEGLDIWNGNAAIQIQPDVQEGDPPLPQHLLPHAVLDSVHITSYSGRGIVSIDGGSVHMRGCAVEDCAATGIYIGGGPGTQAHVERSDVVNNGVGNPHRRTGIARGHSGVYLEQGTARITDCNISNNTLTGISAVSPSNAILALEHCDLMSNGTNQLEMPSRGTVARQRSVTRHNHMSVAGRGRSRSGLLVVQQQQRRVGSFGGL